ncbi:hypothetical protein CW731_09530 [Polaribacter sp. ALD11]|uniref:hypothetical protein n=1 Tax=Polaribacter sp. ALD11 TaxID=2058137 RepID=UPI000C317F8E|nr:hypothetical protein [Polaribacter sp. ALD11]AUC85516.1 hypothetical protein CW731_09530 [Polaribacter sp. ALD11]
MPTNKQPNKINNNNEEEVDLGSLFVIIGKGFTKFFNFIKDFFKGIFHIIISVLIFLKDNFVKIGVAAIIGLVIGFVLEVKKGKTYASDLLVEPNFKSARQLYNNVKFYNDLVRQKDTARIQKTFQLDKETAGSLKKFTIEPIVNENDIINSYDDFILSVDTTTVKSYTFDEFKRSFTDLDYKIHKIHVIAQKNDVFDQLDEIILSSVMDNKYFNRVKELVNENLNRTDSLLRMNLGQVDSLRRIYMQVMLEEAKKQSNGTSIDLGGEKRTTKELELFETNRKLNAELESVVLKKSNKYEVINVISNFQPIGYEIKEITKNIAFQLAALGALFMIFVLLLIKVNTYLSSYKK